ncbi:MAG: hypothetical protein ACFE0Q_21610 [Anaerolineae bacterium]
MQRFLRNLLWTIGFSVLSVSLIAAQVNACAALLEDALLAVEDNCDEAGRNEACYGFNQVSASFASEVSDDFFTQPRDLTPINILETIRTAPLSVDTNTWGVALMNIQANLPNTLPGQNVTFILMGDVEVENAVEPENAFSPDDGVEIVITSPAGANIRSGAGLNFNVIGGARPDETLLTDGVSPDGEWFRVAYNDRVAWINRTVIDDSTPELADLPTLTDDLVTPMQAFYLRTGVGRPECEEVPDDILMVQGPENIEVNITVNGADIRIGSTVGLRVIMVDGEPFLEVIAFAGEINFMGQRLFPGQRSLACLGEEDSRGQDGEANDLVVTCDPSPPEPVEDFGENWCVLEQLPANLLNYSIDILCPGEVPIVNNPTTSTGATSSNVPTVNCSGFGLISPLTPVNSGTHTFSWNPVSGDNISYQLVFWNFEGQEVESFFTNETSYTLNLGSDTSTGGQFSWEVRAYQNGEYACVTFRSPTLTRTGELNPAGEFSASVTRCGDFTGLKYEADVVWSNAPELPVRVLWADIVGITGGQNFNSANGSTNIETSYYFYNFQFIEVISGDESFFFGGC